jgi:hypothetical protein
VNTCAHCALIGGTSVENVLQIGGPVAIKKVQLEEGKSNEILALKIEQDLLDQIKERVEDLNTDVSTFIKWCIQTGLFLGNVNSFVKLRISEDINR